MKKLVGIFRLYGKPVKTIIFSFLLTFFALVLTWSAVKIIVKRDAMKDAGKPTIEMEAGFAS